MAEVGICLVTCTASGFTSIQAVKAQGTLSVMDVGQVLMLSFSSMLLWSWLSVSSITKISCSASVLAYRRCLASFCWSSWLEEIWRAFFGRIDPGWWDKFPARLVVAFSMTVFIIFMNCIKVLKPSRAGYVSQLRQISGYIHLFAWCKQMSVRENESSARTPVY